VDDSIRLLLSRVCNLVLPVLFDRVCCSNQIEKAALLALTRHSTTPDNAINILTKFHEGAAVGGKLLVGG
jgi:hypothetical protein